MHEAMSRETYNLELWRRTTKTTHSILQVSHWTNSSCTRSDLVMCMYIGTSVEITANKVWWTGTKKRKREKRMKSCWLLKVISLKRIFFFPSFIYPNRSSPSRILNHLDEGYALWISIFLCHRFDICTSYHTLCNSK